MKRISVVPRTRIVLSLLSLSLAAASYAQQPADPKADAKAATKATAKPAAQAAGSFKPVPLPDPKIPGFTFPTPAAVITGWTQKDDQAAIHRHAWGLWTALTQRTNVIFGGQQLRVFETWETPSDIKAGPAAAPEGLLKALPRGGLEPLRQLHRSKKPVLEATQGDETVTGFVKYDPIGAAHIRSNNLFSSAKLTKLLADGATAVPEFPPPSISLKPVFKVLTANQLVQGRYFKLNTWPGQPAQPKPFPQSDWKNCVWIDIQETLDGPGRGSTDTVCKADGSSRTAATTYGLSAFIAFQLSAAQAEALKAGPLKSAKSGDWAVLTAMHVTTREITEWTWATFWWAPNADNPTLPSTPNIAKLRPAQLTGAPRHYAQCAADQTLKPPQPETGGKNVGESVYCYNPYLEAGFGPGDLPDSLPGTYQGKKVANNVGMQTNCMSCHAAANFNPKNLPTAPNYSGDRYLDLKDPRFKGTLQVDLLWSIPGNAQ